MFMEWTDLHPGNIVLQSSEEGGREGVGEVSLNFLDAGLVVSLTPTDKKNFEELFVAVVGTNIFYCEIFCKLCSDYGLVCK